MKGKDIAISTNTIIEYATDKILEKYGLSPDDVNKVAVPQIPARLEMLQSGKIDAATLPDPLATVAIKNGAKVIESTDRLGINPGVLLFSDQALEQKENEIKAFYRAYNKAVEYLKQNDKSSYIDIVIEKASFPEDVRDTIVMIKVRNLVVYYGKFKALSGINLDVKKGGIIALIGPSGCGKTTLLYVLGGIVAKYEGEVLIDGAPVDPKKQRIGLVLQDYGLLPWKRVWENALLGLKVKKKVIGKEDKEYAEYVLARVGLSDFLKRYPGELSGGQRQRVAIARAFIMKPDILLMDEPFSALDAITREEMQDLFIDVWKGSSVSTVFVTHSTEEAMFVGEKIAVMTGPPGRIVEIVDNPFFSRREIEDSDLYFSMKLKLKELIKGM